MTYGRLAVAGSLALLALGAWQAYVTLNGMAAVPWWLAAPVPTLVAYGLYGEHTDRSVFDLGRDVDADGLGDRVDEQVRETVPDPFRPAEPEPFLPDCGPWPPAGGQP